VRQRRGPAPFVVYFAGVKHLWALGRVVSLVAACAASVPLASQQADLAAKRFQPPLDKAGVYVYRPDQFKLSALTLNVSIDGVLWGQTKVGSYLYAELPPGQYVLSSQSEAETPVRIQVEAGRQYYFQQDIAFGSSSVRSTLLPVDEQTGRAAVMKSELAVTQPPAKAPPPLGCTKDADCKGERICNRGSCVDPPPRAP
jgi:hypothetical protein